MSDRSTLRRKHAGVDLSQVVVLVEEYKRPLNSKCGTTGQLLSFVHLAIVATTENGQLYLIEKTKGDATESGDIDYPVRYREGKCRIVQISQKEIRDWRRTKSVNKVESGITLEDLFDACGQGYNVFADNCWNGTHRMRACANPEEEDGWTWQRKAFVGAAAAVGVIAIGALTYRGSGTRDKTKR